MNVTWSRPIRWQLNNHVLNKPIKWGEKICTKIITLSLTNKFETGSKRLSSAADFSDAIILASSMAMISAFEYRSIFCFQDWSSSANMDSASFNISSELGSTSIDMHESFNDDIDTSADWRASINSITSGLAGLIKSRTTRSKWFRFAKETLFLILNDYCGR